MKGRSVESRVTSHESQDAKRSYRLIYLLGPGHCGSTLLDMVLGAHPQIMALGEVNGIHRFWAMTSHAAPAAVPRHPLDWVEVSSHPFAQPQWQQVVRCFERSGEWRMDDLSLRHPSWRRALTRWSDDDVRRWARPNAALFDCWHEVCGRPMLTDASKRPQRLYLLARSGMFDLSVIHLIRDGRGVMYSFLRKYGRWGLAFRRWAGPTLMAFYLRRYLRSTPWLDVRYEALATDPHGTVARVCAFLDVPYQPEMLQFRSYDYAGLGGNRMRERGDDRIVFDDRWRRDWQGPGRLAFALAGGWLNRLCGY
jgi:hypothetical protein